MSRSRAISLTDTSFCVASTLRQSSTPFALRFPPRRSQKATRPPSFASVWSLAALERAKIPPRLTSLRAWTQAADTPHNAQLSGAVSACGPGSASLSAIARQLLGASAELSERQVHLQGEGGRRRLPLRTQDMNFIYSRVATDAVNFGVAFDAAGGANGRPGGVHGAWILRPACGAPGWLAARGRLHAGVLCPPALLSRVSLRPGDDPSCSRAGCCTAQRGTPTWRGTGTCTTSRVSASAVSPGVSTTPTRLLPRCELQMASRADALQGVRGRQREPLPGLL